MILVNKKKTENDILIKKYNIGNNKPEDMVVSTVCEIASVCYQSKVGKSERLYNMLMRENSGGLPSSAFSFVPVSVTPLEMNQIMTAVTNTEELESYPQAHTCPSLMKYGYFNTTTGTWICNFRSLVYDHRHGYLDVETYERIMDRVVPIDVYLYKVENMTMYTFGHMVRHSMALQVMSRRFVSDDKSPFKFYTHSKIIEKGLDGPINILQASAVGVYGHLIEHGIHREVARGYIQQCATTDFWFKWNTPVDEANFITMRTAKSAQDEIRFFASALEEL